MISVQDVKTFLTKLEETEDFGGNAARSWLINTGFWEGGMLYMPARGASVVDAECFISAPVKYITQESKKGASLVKYII